jgi:PTH1 family peptidyl-tRNA hydrolase
MVQLVLGLGNPGERYAATRHNVGFRCVEEVARRLGLAFGEVTSTYRAAVGEGPGGRLTLLEPLTYMNRSGLAVLDWSQRTGLPVVDPGQPPDLQDPGASPVVPVVVCDDLHLPLGSIRIRPGGSDGGQNGLASVLEAVATTAVPRLRLGVGPAEGELDPADWADYVLQPFAASEQEQVDGLVTRASDALLDLIEFGPAEAAARHNRRIRRAPDLPAGD